MERPTVDKLHWKRLFRQHFEASESPPELRLRVGQGIHLQMAIEDALPFEVVLSPAGEGPAFFQTSTTSMVYIGKDGPTPTESSWLDAIRAGISEAEEDAAWSEALAESMRRPGISSGGRRGSEQISSGDELILRLLEPCNARCDFCACIGVMPDATASFEQARSVMQEGFDAGYRHVVFTGGEPTLLDNLPDFVATARKMGFTRVNIQTNGVRLAEEARVEKLAAAGLDGVLLSLHSHQASVHDRILKLEGAFEGAVAGIENLIKHRVRVSLNYVIHTENLSDIDAFLLFIYRRFERGIPGWHGHLSVTLSFVSPIGWTLEHTDLIPRITTVAPKLARALDVAEAIGMDVHIPGLCGIPLCTMPGYEDFFDEYRGVGVPQLETREWVPACDDCHWRDRCSGYWKTYFSLYGTGELGLGLPRGWGRGPAPPLPPALLEKITAMSAESLHPRVIADRLNRGKIRTPRGGRWTDKAIAGLLEEHGVDVVWEDGPRG